jgi:hypothetical protein
VLHFLSVILTPGLLQKCAGPGPYKFSSHQKIASSLEV